MTSRFSGGDMEFELRTAPAAVREQYREEPPFCMAVLGDFSGRANRGLCQKGTELSHRQRWAADVDNFDKLPGKLGAEIYIPIGGEEGPRIEIRFGELDDFHPDRLYDRLEIFQRLKALRRCLQDASTFAAAAAEVRSWTTGRPDTDASVPPPPEKGPAQGQESDTDTLERLLGKQPVAKPPPAGAKAFVNVESLIREVVKPYIVAGADPQQAKLIAQVDQAISGQMRALLHDPDFQQLEAAWRMLHFMVSRVETDETLKLYIIDISKAELAADLLSPESLQTTGAYRLIVEKSIGIPGADPWALLVGAYTFDKTEEDVILLRKLAKIAQAAGAPLLAGADSHFAGCESIAATPDPDDWRLKGETRANQRWEELRGAPEAAFVGLTLPRFLLRLPYGRETESIDRFGFEELSEAGDHGGHLWGNSAAACACLLAEAFRESGWNLSNALGCDMTGLCVHVFEHDGKKHVMGGAETLLTDRAAEILIDKGLMPVLSIKGRDMIKIARFQSIAAPPMSLAGRWR